MVDTKAVSVRLPLDLLNELNTYATDRGMVRSGDANIGGTIIAILREHFGGSDNVKQVSDSMDIKSIVNSAVESRLEAVLNQVESLRLKVHSQETYSLLYDHLKADVDIRFDVTSKAIAALISEATVTVKKHLMQLAPLPIIDALPNPDTAATAKPKVTKKRSKKSGADRRFTAEEAAEYYSAQSGKPLSASSLKANAKKYGFEIKERRSGLYALIDS